MAKRFYPRQADYIEKLNELGDNYDEAIDALGGIAQSKEDAANAAANAATSEANSLSSRNAAATSEANALASQNAAATSASEALTSEQAAATSEANAKASETAAATSAGAALASEQAAATSEANALASQNAAATSASEALSSEQAAATSETNAKASETAAATSETNAKASETAAATSASEALASEQAAATSEANALASQNAAATSASEALASEQAALSSQQLANTSAAQSLTLRNQTEGFMLQTEAARDAAAAIFEAFGDKYLGDHPSHPNVATSGAALETGDVYFNTTDNVLKFYTGTEWVSPEKAASQYAQDSLNYSESSEQSMLQAQAFRDLSEADKNSAATSEANALASQNAAATSASEALASEQSAATSEANALASQNAAATSASEALASEQAAATSETNAKASETAAATSASEALASEQAAATSETNAKASETAAATSASEALASEQASATSETNAKASETAAATSASQALASEQAAATSEANALASQNAAATSAGAALASEQAAAASETNAKASETAAATSETNAKASETAAATSASAALGSEQAAATSEANALASQNAAATSASEALASEQASATSETNAAISAADSEYWAEQAEMVVVDGIIEDGSSSLTKTWSSQKVSSELSGKTNISDIVDTLTSISVDRPLSANQGRVLKSAIDNLTSILSSDDTTLDELQEIVDYIKQNRQTLENLGISNIAGLQNALDAKAASATLVSAGDGLSGGGSLSSTVNLSVDSTVVRTSDTRLTNSREWTAATVGQAEAQAGTATTRRAWTAQRIFQAISSWWNGSSAKTKLDGIQAGAQVNVATNLGYTASTRLLTSSTGTNVTLPQVTTSDDGLMTAADKSKLNGIATGATSNTGTVTSVTGGDGLSGTVTTAGSLAVDGTVVRTTGNQTIGGIKTFTSDTSVQGLTIQDMGSVASRVGLNFKRASAEFGMHMSHSRLYIEQLNASQGSGIVIGTNNNIGIGVNGNPTEKLEVNGKIRIGTQATNTTDAVRADRSLTAGDGLSGGGNLTSNRTFAVDNTVVRTSGNQSMSGVKTFTTALAVTGTSKAAGRFYAGTTDPTNSTRTNYDGNLHAKGFGTGRFMMEYNDVTESLDFNFS